MSANVPPSQVPLESQWRHLPTSVYEMNYGYGINYYQPMIDYLDKKEKTARLREKTTYPTLPWTDGRALWVHKPVTPYSNTELSKHAIAAEIKAKEHLNHFKVFLTLFSYFV